MRGPGLPGFEVCGCAQALTGRHVCNARNWHGALGRTYTGRMMLTYAIRPLTALLSRAWARPFAATLLALAGAAAQAAPPVSDEVIVGFKSDASVLRKHAMAATARGDAVRQVLVQRASSLGARVGRTLQAGAAVGAQAQVVRAAGVDAATLARQLAADPDVAYAVPNGRKRIVAAPNDPLYPAAASGVRPSGPDSGQWYLRAPDTTIKSAIDIEAAWARTTGSNSVVVAVLDTGVRFEHPDLGRVASGGQLLPGYDFINDTTTANDGDGRDGDPSDPGDFITAGENASGPLAGCGAGSSSWHGTATSSIVGARTNDRTGMAGSAPGVRVQPVRVLGKCGGYDSDIIAGMRWAAGLSVDGVPANPTPAKVLNMSLGGTGACSAAYQAAVDEIVARGVTIVAAAGNSAGGPVSEPANCRGVVGVLALRHAGTKVGFSDLGSEITIAAPGGNCINITAGSPCLYPILAATDRGTQGPTGSTWTDSFDISVGTSFSSPLVAGVVALMVSQSPAISTDRIRTALTSTARAFPTTGADNGPDDPTPVATCQAPASGVQQLQCYCTTALCGAGMLDAGRAVAAVSGSLAVLDQVTAGAVAGVAVVLSGSGSQPAPGSSIVSYAWTLLNGGGIVTAFTSATNASTASLTPTAAGSFTVQLVVTDGLGNSNTGTRTITVAAAPVVQPPAVGGGGGGGGGASSGAWVAGVALAAAVLRALRRRA
jgi:serine protease